MEIGHDRRARLLAVTILGWVFVAFSVLAIFSSALAFTILRIIARQSPGDPFPPKVEDLPALAPMEWMLRNLDGRCWLSWRLRVSASLPRFNS